MNAFKCACLLCFIVAICTRWIKFFSWNKSYDKMSLRVNNGKEEKKISGFIFGCYKSNSFKIKTNIKYI